MKVVAWSILIELDNGKRFTSADMPDYVAQVVDDWLNELESEEE
tara:strand:- start:32 stop:163 length:132 start_codon:yes stop_codon:yes gene_type:complete